MHHHQLDIFILAAPPAPPPHTPPLPVIGLERAFPRQTRPRCLVDRPLIVALVLAGKGRDAEAVPRGGYVQHPRRRSVGRGRGRAHVREEKVGEQRW